jgi:hypothetical protein
MRGGQGSMGAQMTGGKMSQFGVSGGMGGSATFGFMSNR